jgi:hypothetical protein
MMSREIVSREMMSREIPHRKAQEQLQTSDNIQVVKIII